MFESASIRREPPWIRSLWLGFGVLGILSDLLFLWLGLKGEPGISLGYSGCGAAATGVWFYFGAQGAPSPLAAGKFSL